MPEDKSKVGVAIAIVVIVSLAGLASGIYWYYTDELEQYIEDLWGEDKDIPGNENTTEEIEENPEEVPEEEEPQEPEEPEPPPSIPKPKYNVCL